MRRPRAKDRRGAVAVEFAFIAPLFVAMFVGLTQVTYLMQVQNQFAMAAREGARTASFDRAAFNPGQSTNDKMEEDIRNFLDANGLPGDDVDIVIADAANEDVPFDLDDPANEFEYFQVIVEYSASDLFQTAPPGTDEFKISARVIFRNGRVN